MNRFKNMEIHVVQKMLNACIKVKHYDKELNMEKYISEIQLELDRREKKKQVETALVSPKEKSNAKHSRKKVPKVQKNV